MTGRGAWTLGWIQTVPPCQTWVSYLSSTNAAHHSKLIAKLDQAMRDGDDGVIWYDETSSSCLLIPGEPVTVTMSDEPDIGFCHPAHDGARYPRLRNWVPQACGGAKEFWTWLVARENTTGEQDFTPGWA